MLTLTPAITGLWVYLIISISMISSYTWFLKQNFSMLSPHPAITVCFLPVMFWMFLIQTNNVQVIGCVCGAYDPMSPLLYLLRWIPYPVPDWKDGHDGISSKTIWLVLLPLISVQNLLKYLQHYKTFCMNSSYHICINAIVVLDTLIGWCLVRHLRNGVHMHYTLVLWIDCWKSLCLLKYNSSSSSVLSLMSSIWKTNHNVVWHVPHAIT
jgi:hypothetical protein